MKSERERLRRPEDSGSSTGAPAVRGEAQSLAIAHRALGEALAHEADLDRVRDAVERSLLATGVLEALTLSVRRDAGRVEVLVSRATGRPRRSRGRDVTRLLRFEGVRVGHVFAHGPAAAAVLDALAPWLAVAVGACLAREAAVTSRARATKAARERARAEARLRAALARHPRPAFEVSLEGLVAPRNEAARRALAQKGEALEQAIAQAVVSEHPRWRSVAATTGDAASFLVLEREAAADAREAAARFARALALTPRQAEVLERLVLGASNREIARALGCADVTVEKHVATLFSRAGTTDRARLAVAVLTGNAALSPRAASPARASAPAPHVETEVEPIEAASSRPDHEEVEPGAVIGLLVGKAEAPAASRRRELASIIAESRRDPARERVREEAYGRLARAVTHHAALHALVEGLVRSLRAQLDAESVRIAVSTPAPLDDGAAPEGVRLRHALVRGGEHVGVLELHVRAEQLEPSRLTVGLLAPFVAARLGASLDRAAAEEALARAIGDEDTAESLTSALAEARRAAREPASSVGARAAAFATRRGVGPRDREVLLLLAQGLSNKEIATSLGVAEVTVEARLTALYRAAHVRGRQGLLLAMLSPTKPARRR